MRIFYLMLLSAGAVVHGVKPAAVQAEPVVIEAGSAKPVVLEKVSPIGTILIIGEQSVGKSAFALLVKNGSFSGEAFSGTVEPFTVTREAEGAKYIMRIEEVPSAASDSVIATKWKSAAGVILVCSLVGKSCKRLEEKYAKYVQTNSALVAVFGNKSDLLPGLTVQSGNPDIVTPASLNRIAVGNVRAKLSYSGSVLLNEIAGSSPNPKLIYILDQTLLQILKIRKTK